MAHQAVREVPSDEADAGQELVDAIVDAVDSSRSDEVARLRVALEPFGLSEALRDELWLSGRSTLDGPSWCREVA